MPVLGLSAFYHDSAAAIVDETGIVAACQEERYSRRKNDPRFPKSAIADCLALAGLKASDIEAVVYYERPLAKLERLRRLSEGLTDSDGYFVDAASRWLRDGQLGLERTVAETVGIDPSRLHRVSHHQSHAASAYYVSPFDAATVVTLDGVGEDETASISVARGNAIDKLDHVCFPHSLGLFYSVFTAFLGFEVNEGEYKVMGMAPFGRPTRKDDILGLFELRSDGTFRVDQGVFSFDPTSRRHFTDAMVEWMGEPRTPEELFDPMADGTVGERSRHYADIAASVQAATEEVICHVVRSAVARTGIRQVCLAGGVALNSVANGRLMREEGIDLFVQPAAGDAGGALGAALWHWHNDMGRERLGAQTHALLGHAPLPEATERAVSDCSYRFERLDDPSALLDRCADAIAAGKVIGWVQGRAEWGPRSLGARSILAAPHPAAMRDLVNEKIKFRELFRPFAPAVPADEAARFFEFPEDAADRSAPLSFMLSVCNVRDEVKTRIPAITHVDGSARVQTVHEGANPLFYGLLKRVGARTGVPVLMNTSFNRRGEPIVNDAFDAVTTFRIAGLDCLAVGPYFIEKD